MVSKAQQILLLRSRSPSHEIGLEFALINSAIANGGEGSEQSDPVSTATSKAQSSRGPVVSSTAHAISADPGSSPNRIAAARYHKSLTDRSSAGLIIHCEQHCRPRSAVPRGSAPGGECALSRAVRCLSR